MRLFGFVESITKCDTTYDNLAVLYLSLLGGSLSLFGIPPVSVESLLLTVDHKSLH